MRPAADSGAARLVLLLTALFLVALWAFVAFWGYTSRQESVDHAGELLRRMNHAVEEQTRRQFQIIEVFFDAAEEWLAANPDTKPQGEIRLGRLSDALVARTGGAIGVAAADAGAGLLPLAGKEVRLRDRTAVRDALAGPGGQLVIGAPVADPEGGAWSIPVVRKLPVPRAGVAALVAVIRLPPLLAMYEEERLRPNGAIVLLRRDGIVLARAPYDERLMGRSVADGELYRKHLPQRDSGVVLLDRTVTDAMDKLASYSVFPDLPLLIVVSGAMDDVTALWWRHMQITLLLALGVSLASLVGAARLVRVLGELSVRTAELQRLATTDLMTGLGNRHHFLAQLYHEFARGRRYGTTLSLLVLDLDFFKQINDGYGHAAGDAALKAFSREAQTCLRELDAIGRLGGEEFGILLPNTGIDQAALVAERIRGAVAHIAIETDFGTVRFTTSIGVTQSTNEDTSIDTLLARADAALYEAKAAGRNRVVSRPA